MKATGLMINDWVAFKEDPNIVIWIKSINPDDTVWALLDYDDEGCDKISIDEIAPIPLTAEILEQNGFTYVGKEVWQWEKKPFWVWWEEETRLLGIEIDESSYNEEKTKTVMTIVQNYVHELQHALRLCGLNELADNWRV